LNNTQILKQKPHTEIAFIFDQAKPQWRPASERKFAALARGKEKKKKRSSMCSDLLCHYIKSFARENWSVKLTLEVEKAGGKYKGDGGEISQILCKKQGKESGRGGAGAYLSEQRSCQRTDD
jgi:hypothetical protein